MSSYFVFKLVHLIGIFFLITTAGGVALYAANGGNKEDNVGRTWVAAVHGISLMVIVITGFGLVANVQTGFQPWVWAKFALWFLIGSFALMPLRRPKLAVPFYFLIPLLGGVAAWLALFKPF